jgi:hypothetical protein
MNRTGSQTSLGTATGFVGSRPGTANGSISHRPKHVKSQDTTIEVTGKIECVVKGWSKILGAFPAYESKVYSLYGNLWQLKVMPNGNLAQTSDFVGILLVNKSDRPIHAHYSISLKNQRKTGKDVTWTDPDGEVLFGSIDSGDDYWGCDDFISRAELEDPGAGFLVDDALVVTVEVTAKNVDVLGALTPITAAPVASEEDCEDSSLAAASDELQELSVIMKQKVRLLSEDAILQDKLIKVRLGECEDDSGATRAARRTGGRK